MAAHELPEVTVVADAGMMSEANLKRIEDAGLRFIVGARIPDVPYQVKKWRQDHPDEPIADRQIFVQPTVMGPKTDQRRPDDHLPVPAGPGETDTAGHRHPDRESGEGDQGPGRGQAEPVRPTHRRHQDDQPGPGGQDPRPGRVEGLHHQPRGPDPGLCARRLPPAVEDREELPHVQVRPAGPADLPPQTRIDRSPPDHRDGRARRSATGWNAPPTPRSRRSCRHYAATAASPSRPATTSCTPAPHSTTTPSHRQRSQSRRCCALI